MNTSVLKGVIIEAFNTIAELSVDQYGGKKEVNEAAV